MTAESPGRAPVRADTPAVVYRAQEQDKPWGHEQIFAAMDGRYVGKVIHVTAGNSLSLQYHEHKEETISLISGEADIQYGPVDGDLTTRRFGPGDTIHLPPRVVHRVTAITDIVFAEASTAPPAGGKPDQAGEQLPGVVERRRLRGGVLGGVVPVPQPAGRLRVRAGSELVKLRSAHRPALDAERVDRGRGERPGIAGLDRAQIPLGRDVQPHGLGDLGAEPLRQPVRTGVAVPVVRAAHQLATAHRAGEVADIVQQRGGDHGVVGAVELGQVRGLEHVRGLSHRLAEVLGGSLAREQVRDPLDRISARHRRGSSWLWARLPVLRRPARPGPPAPLARRPALTAALLPRESRRRRQDRRSSPAGAGCPPR